MALDIEISRRSDYFFLNKAIPPRQYQEMFMDSNRNSVESQLRTRCNILESQVKTLEKQKSDLPKNLVIKDNIQAEQWKEVAGIGRFPA